MVSYTPRGYPYPDAGDSVSPQSRDFVNLATSIDADVASLVGKDDPILLTETSDVDALTPGVYMVPNVVIARALNLPWEYPSVIRVEPASTGGAVAFKADTLEQPPRQFLRSRLNNGTISAWAEVAMISGMESGDTSGTVRRDLLRQGLTARKGGTIGTAGKGVVALRFDDAPADFATKVLPLLRERGLPFTRVSTSDSIASTGETITDTDLTEMQDYCIADGGEVWNHGRDHANATGDAAIYDNLIGSLHKLREKMPRIPVDCFAPPGGSVSYGGYMPAYAVSNWSDTYAGRLLMAHHALASGYFRDSYYRPLDGQLRDGQIHYSVDAYTLTKAKELVDRARDWRVGVVMMWHGHNLDTEGNMSTADLEAFLDYLVAERDAGNVLVLTKSGLGVADARSDQRDNALITSAGDPFSESITYPQYRQGVLGSTRELLATVTGTAGATVTSAIGESVRTHTIPASGTLALRHVATIPLDVTSLAVSIDAATTEARLSTV